MALPLFKRIWKNLQHSILWTNLGNENVFLLLWRLLKKWYNIIAILQKFIHFRNVLFFDRLNKKVIGTFSQRIHLKTLTWKKLFSESENISGIRKIRKIRKTFSEFTESVKSETIFGIYGIRKIRKKHFSSFRNLRNP